MEGILLSDRIRSGRDWIAVHREKPVDLRNIKHGSIVPDEGYCDQPYVVITNDGAWLCVMDPRDRKRRVTAFQHIVSRISTEQRQDLDGMPWTSNPTDHRKPLGACR